MDGEIGPGRALLPLMYARKMVRYWTSKSFDQRLGIETTNLHHDGFLHHNLTRRKAVWPRVEQASSFGDATYSIPIGYQNLVRARLALGRVTADDVMVDLGCGLGRALFYFGKTTGMRKLVGVEYDETAFSLLQKNVRQSRVQGKFVGVLDDAANYNFTDETIIYMYNPFGEKTLNRVLDNLERNVLDMNREVRILYFRETGHETLIRRKWIRRIHKFHPLPRVLMPFSIYTTTPT